MRRIQLLLVIVLSASVFSTCGSNGGSVEDYLSNGEYWKGIIPKPQSYVVGTGFYTLNYSARVVVKGRTAPETDELIRTGEYFALILRSATGYQMPVVTGDPQSGDIVIKTSDTDPSLGKEGYTVSASTGGVIVSAYTPEGAFRGMQTVRQMFPPEIEKKTLSAGIAWSLPVSEIRDLPTYEWRGTMLDVSRHFFPVDTVKRSIDLAASYKINIFHLHLTDDQGWRIEIKSWPKLTTVGGRTQIDGKTGGFYTQEEYSDIVKYASARYITIVPEIEMPAHVNAALASYGELNPSGKPSTLLGGGTSTLMCRADTTWIFVSDVIREISAITPGGYIHIGGDEAESTSENDYKYFIGRVNEIVKSNGKTMIGWNPVQTGENIYPGSVMQYWVNIHNDIHVATDAGMKIILSPAHKAYLDMKYSSSTLIGLSWAGYISVLTGYMWDPSEFVSTGNVIGVECPLWTETVDSVADIDYLTYPRLPGYAEIGWTINNLRDMDEYLARLRVHEKRMTNMNINYAKAF